MDRGRGGQEEKQSNVYKIRSLDRYEIMAKATANESNRKKQQKKIKLNMKIAQKQQGIFKK